MELSQAFFHLRALDKMGTCQVALTTNYRFGAFCFQKSLVRLVYFIDVWQKADSCLATLRSLANIHIENHALR
jgi:hypothetical protein